MPSPKRNYQKEWAQERKRQELPARAARARARRAYDAAGVDRTGKHIDHKVPLSLGGSSSLKNTRLVKPKTNLSYPRRSNHKPK
jgi:5-methylcytosine-specific restriction endonuclease McrA